MRPERAPGARVKTLSRRNTDAPFAKRETRNPKHGTPASDAAANLNRGEPLVAWNLI